MVVVINDTPSFPNGALFTCIAYPLKNGHETGSSRFWNIAVILFVDKEIFVFRGIFFFIVCFNDPTPVAIPPSLLKGRPFMHNKLDELDKKRYEIQQCWNPC